jgi:hypothetical protein
MVRQGRFFNPSRASPLDVTVRDNYQGRQDVYIQKQHAVAVCTGYCTDSYLVRGGKYKKSISVLFHGQEWERYCCFMTMIFDKTSLAAQLYQSALTFATLPKSVLPPPVFNNAIVSPLSGRKAKLNDTPLERSRGALYFSDTGNSQMIKPDMRSLKFFFFKFSTCLRCSANQSGRGDCL